MVGEKGEEEEKKGEDYGRDGGGGGEEGDDGWWAFDDFSCYLIWVLYSNFDGKIVVLDLVETHEDGQEF